MKTRKCKDCDEPFDPVGREIICPECRLERDANADEARTMRKQPSGRYHPSRFACSRCGDLNCTEHA